MNKNITFIRFASKATLEIRQDNFKVLRGLTRQVSNQLNTKNKTETNRLISPDIASDQIIKNFKADKLKLVETHESNKKALPLEFRKKLGLVSDLLLQNSSSINEYSLRDSNILTNQWNIIFEQLNLAGGFENVPQSAITELIRSIPRKELKYFIPTIERLYQNAELKVPNKVYNYFIRSLTIGGSVTNSELTLIETYLKKIEQQSDLKINHYETLIYAYVKNNQMNKVESVLELMKLKKIEITSSILIAIMQGYIFYTKDYKKALQTFDAMKFASVKTQPKERAYSDIIVACVMNKDLERALDLFEEMKEKKLNVNQGILCSLAKGCSKLKKYKEFAWKFLFEIYEKNWTPNLTTFESMLYLSAQDGDVALTRALFYKMLETNAVTLKGFMALLLAYSKFETNKEQIPKLINLNAKGRIFRENIINEIDFLKPINDFPFLPYKELNDQLILAESSAIWAYMILNKFNFLDKKLVTLYLSIASNSGSLKDFEDRFLNTTYLDDTGAPLSREITDNEIPAESKNEALLENPLNSNSKSLIKSPILSKLESTQNFMVPRDTLIYIIALQAAAKANSVEFIQSIIHERGKYRKSQQFKTLSQDLQKKLDFDFAFSLCEAYTKLNMLDDALAIILSTEDIFNWNKLHMKNLKLKAIEAGNSNIVNELQNIQKA